MGIEDGLGSTYGVYSGLLATDLTLSARQTDDASLTLLAESPAETTAGAATGPDLDNGLTTPVPTRFAPQQVQFGLKKVASGSVSLGLEQQARFGMQQAGQADKGLTVAMLPALSRAHDVGLLSAKEWQGFRSANDGALQRLRSSLLTGDIAPSTAILAVQAAIVDLQANTVNLPADCQRQLKLVAMIAETRLGNEGDAAGRLQFFEEVLKLQQLLGKASLSGADLRITGNIARMTEMTNVLVKAASTLNTADRSGHALANRELNALHHQAAMAILLKGNDLSAILAACNDRSELGAMLKQAGFQAQANGQWLSPTGMAAEFDALSHGLFIVARDALEAKGLSLDPDGAVTPKEGSTAPSGSLSSDILTGIVEQLQHAEDKLGNVELSMGRFLSKQELEEYKQNKEILLKSVKNLGSNTPPATAAEAITNAMTQSILNGEPTVSQDFLVKLVNGEDIDYSTLNQAEQLLLSRLRQNGFADVVNGRVRVDIKPEDRERLLSLHQFITNPSSPAMADLRDALVAMMQAQYQAEMVAHALGVQLADLIRMAERLTVQMERLADELAAMADRAVEGEAPADPPAAPVDRGALAETETLVQADAEQTHRVGQQYLQLMRRGTPDGEGRTGDSTAARHAAALDRQDARLRSEYQHAVEAKAQDLAKQRREARVVGEQVVQGVDGTAVIVETNAKGQAVGQSAPAADK